MQKQRGFLFARVDGKIHDFISSAADDEWRKRRRILTPAFSAHKMKLVGEVVITLNLMHFIYIYYIYGYLIYMYININTYELSALNRSL